ncbi:MAG TPA: ABC transporter permease [Vicinamibacterales bacterium]|jgi:ABC-2 type transport system permease protein|nr:ABC transporter permease [Vicinamibacterales bacterium]
MDTITASLVTVTGDDGEPVERQRLGRAVTQWSVTKAEWIKLQSVRVNVVGILAAGAALVLLGVLFSALAPTDMGPGGTATDSVSFAFGGISLSQLIIGVLAALFVGSEYASGLIRTTFGAVARRTRVLRAKAIVFGCAAWLAMTFGAFGAFFAGSAVYSGNLPSYAIGDPGVLRAVLSAGFYGACVALIGIAVGFLVRSTAAAIGLLLGLLMLAPLLTELLPGTAGDTLTQVLPSNAGKAIMSLTSPDNLLSPGLGFAVLAAWVVGLLAAAAVTLRRRDA